MILRLTAGKAALVLVGTSFATGGCETRREVVVERPAPVVVRQPVQEVVVAQPVPVPPPTTEVVTVSPGPDFIWVAGANEWIGGRWVWVGGHWERPVHPGAVWVQGRWHPARGGYAWERGHWR